MDTYFFENPYLENGFDSRQNLAWIVKTWIWKKVINMNSQWYYKDHHDSVESILLIDNMIQLQINMINISK